MRHRTLSRSECRGLVVALGIIVLNAWLAFFAAAESPAEEAWSTKDLHPPLTAAAPDFEPRPYRYREPAPLDLPSDADLRTTVVEGRHFHIKRPPAGAYDPARETEGARIFENEEEALYFRGTGGSGRESRERLIVRDCTFVIDFEPGDHPGGNFGKWDPRRGAIVVEGYREVVIENCVFVSRATKHDPIRKITGSIVANYCLKVRINQCYFEGASLGWRGHILVWGGGPTEITNVEIAGARQGTTFAMGGGIWVAHGEKIGWTHGGNPGEMIYPNGPLRIENVHIHDQQGRQNTDGIYVQSIQPYLIRNSRVENWKGQDSLIDVGFRDTFQGFRGERLINHGAIGVIEHCHFGDGYVKSSVGLAGGLIFRHNVMHNAWMFPYVFDGGDWYVLGNQFEEMTGVIVSGRNAQLDGWTPGEGMFARGSRMHLYGNAFSNRVGKQLPALYVNNNPKSPLDRVIVADHNAYRFDPMPRSWAIDQAMDRRYSLADWRATGNDRHSVVGPDASAPAPMPPLDLPGGLRYDMTEAIEPGLTGPVGVTNAWVIQQARRLSDAARQAYDRRYVEIEFEDMEVVDRADGLNMSFKPSSYWSGRGTIRIEPRAGQHVTFKFSVPHGNRYSIHSRTVKAGPRTRATLLIDGKVVDETFNAAAGGNEHAAHHLDAGDHTLTFRYREDGTHRLDRLDLAAYPLAEEQADQQARLEQQSARQRLEARQAATTALEAEDLAVIESTAFVDIYPNKKASNGQYLLLMPKRPDEGVILEIRAPRRGAYELLVATVDQQDGGALRLTVNGKPVGEPARINQMIRFDRVRLENGENRVGLTLAEGNPPIKVRLDRIDLVDLAELPN